MSQVTLLPERIGRIFVDALRDWSATAALVRYALAHIVALRHPVVARVLYRQIYFTGIEALRAISLIALLTGIVIIVETVSLVGHQPAILGQIMLWVVVRELGPLLTGIVIIARSSSAAAAELATMKIRGEMNSLRVMGIDPMDILIVPRIVGMTLSVVAVTFYFQLTAILGGFAATSIWYGVPLRQGLQGVIDLMTVTEILASLTKALAFGIMIAATSCSFGLRAKGTVTAVPQAATGAVMRGIITLFLLDGVITYLFFV
ncbi:MAG: ABC transporter permease [Pseudomonadota bacterium]|nr:MAG: ABC transporter permease [Pseudomonadota bacterium]